MATDGRPVTVAVVGASGSGKTTLIEGLVRELTRRGHAVATAKHAHGGYQLDREGSDSARHTAAGAVGVLLVGPKEYAAIWPGAKLADAEAPKLAARLFSEAAVVLVEGFASLPGPKVYVHRRGVAPKVPPRRDEVVCAVADEECGFEPRFAPDEPEAVADFLESYFGL